MTLAKSVKNKCVSKRLVESPAGILSTLAIRLVYTTSAEQYMYGLEESG